MCGQEEKPYYSLIIIPHRNLLRKDEIVYKGKKLKKDLNLPIKKKVEKTEQREKKEKKG